MNGDGQKPKRERLFLTQVREKENQHGAYFIGNFQACDMIIQKSKTEGVWNVFLVQADLDKKNAGQTNKGPQQNENNGSGWGNVRY